MKSNPLSPGPTCGLRPGCLENFVIVRFWTVRILKLSIISDTALDLSLSFSRVFRLFFFLMAVYLGASSVQRNPPLQQRERPKGYREHQRGLKATKHLPRDTTGIVLQLIPACSITFRLSLSGWSLCGALRLSLIPNHQPPSPYTSMAAVLSCPGGDGRGLGPLLEGGPPGPQDSVRTVTQGRDNKHELKSLKRTGRQMKGFG